MTHRITRAIADTLYNARLHVLNTNPVRLGSFAGEDAALDACRILFELEACILLEDSQN